jgi:hypothetical protein
MMDPNARAAALAGLDQYEAFWGTMVVPAVARIRQAAMTAGAGDVIADAIAQGFLDALMALLGAGWFKTDDD